MIHVTPRRPRILLRMTARVVLVAGGVLAIGCDSQKTPVEPTESLPLSAAVIDRGPVGFSLSVTDFKRGRTAHVTSGPSVLENCGSGELSEQTDLLEIVQPSGVVHSRLLGRKLSVGIWLEPIADICSVPFAVGEAHATLVQKDLANTGSGATVLSWHVRGAVTAIEGGQPYRLLIVVHQVQRPDGSIGGNRTDIRLVPVGQ
jgi:hypothetical protein